MKEINNLQFNKIASTDCSKDEIERLAKLAQEGSMQAKLSLILHNQLVLKETINKILTKHKKELWKI